MSATANPSAIHNDLLKSWNGIPEGITETSPNRIDPNGIPAVDFSRSTDNNATSSRFLLDASYLVLKNVNISYNLPSRWVNKVEIASLRLNLTVENLFTLTSLKGMNPQQAFTGLHYNYLPTPRVISLGLSANF
jgi:hypothetical protein